MNSLREKDDSLICFMRLRSKIISDKWRTITLILIYTNKAGVQNCTSYKGIKLTSHTMKLWERVIEWRLRESTHNIENQFRFTFEGQPWNKNTCYED